MISEVGSEPLNVLVNNAGIAVVKPFREITIAEWNQTIGVNVTAPFLLMQSFAGQMPPGSSIVNILSVAAKTAFPNWGAYCMSKFALEGLSQSVRQELRDHCIRVINIYPAATNTEIWDDVAGDWPREKMISAEQVGGYRRLRAVASGRRRGREYYALKLRRKLVSSRRDDFA